MGRKLSIADLLAWQRQASKWQLGCGKLIFGVDQSMII